MRKHQIHKPVSSASLLYGVGVVSTDRRLNADGEHSGVLKKLLILSLALGDS